MLTIGGFLARFTGSETHKKSPIATVGVTHLDPAERERLHWEAMQRGVDELVAELNEERRALSTQGRAIPGSDS